MPIRNLSANDAKKPLYSMRPGSRIDMSKNNQFSRPSTKQTRQINSEMEQALHPAKLAQKKIITRLIQVGIGVVLSTIFIVALGYFGILGNLVSVFRSRVSQKGGMVVTSEFTKANVLLNGKQIGTTPLQLTALDPGEYTVEIVSTEDTAFFKPLKLTNVKVYSGNSAIIKAQIGPTEDTSSYVYITSKDKAATDFQFVITSVPEGVNLKLGDTDLGKTPLTKNDIKPGSQKLTVTKAGYRPIDVELEVNQSKSVEVTVKLYKYILNIP